LIRFPIGVIVDDIPYAILLAQIPIRIPIGADHIQESESARAGTDEHWTGVKLETVVLSATSYRLIGLGVYLPVASQQEINIVGSRGIGKWFFYDIPEFDSGIRD
jgi:hypothetical protein